MSNFIDKMGRPVPSVMVYNRTDLAAYKGPCSKVTITEDFPLYGVISVEPGQVVTVPVDVADRWCDPERWNKQAGWPTTKDNQVAPPITKNIPPDKMPKDTTAPAE